MSNLINNENIKTWKTLAQNIVIRACEDYYRDLQYVKYLKWQIELTLARKKKDEEFFESEDFELYTDGMRIDKVVDILNQRAKNDNSYKKSFKVIKQINNYMSYAELSNSEREQCKQLVEKGQGLKLYAKPFQIERASDIINTILEIFVYDIINDKDFVENLKETINEEFDKYIKWCKGGKK